MGKRELVIALAFVAVGILAYQFTAPPPRAGEKGFSFSRVFNSARRSMQADRAHATYTQHGTFSVGPALTEVRVSHITKAITIRGEARADIAYELKIDSTGPDPDTARSYASRTSLTSDDLGSALELTADYPVEGSQVAELTLLMPERLTARLDNVSSAHLRITGIAGVRFEGGSGEVTVERLTGPVTGQLRSGTLVITAVPSVELTLQAVNATIAGVSRTATLTMRSGRCALTDVSGAIEVDATNTELSVTDPTGPVHIGATGGHVTLTRPAHQAEVEGHRTGIDAALDRAVAMTLTTSDDELHLAFHGAPPAVTLDATATESGTIHVDDPRLAVTTSDGAARLAHAFGPPSAPRIVLRNQRGEIVIGMAK